jgi:hypothetical protein
MSEEFEDIPEDEESDDYKSVDLKYQIFSDEKDNTVYLKFNGFENQQQMDNFIDYIDFSLPLLLYQSSTKH